MLFVVWRVGCYGFDFGWFAVCGCGLLGFAVLCLVGVVGFVVCVWVWLFWVHWLVLWILLVYYIALALRIACGFGMFDCA